MPIPLLRRTLIGHALALPAAAATGDGSPPLASASSSPSATPPEEGFSFATVQGLASDLAAHPYKAPDNTLPPGLDNLTYDQYRAIRFRKDKALWDGLGLHFTVEFFHRGFIYKDRVQIFEVDAGVATPIAESPDLFTFGQGVSAPKDTDLGFAGFRIHAPINRIDYYDEVCAFLGASYFRAVAKGQTYGLSARGLSIKTADPTGEEFPAFRSFWIVRPAPDTPALSLFALLDSPSAAGAFRFSISPGEETVFDIDASLFPRADLTKAGLAPLTSMFWFDPNDRSGIDDYRPAVHDSGGLEFVAQTGETVWRPLANPRTLQVSAFQGTGMKGFGLDQRPRGFAAYDDLEAKYQERPTLWIEPKGDWGAGEIDLVEIPTRQEINDNIVAFWRPHDKLAAGQRHDFSYRQHWCWTRPGRGALAEIASTRSGLGPGGKSRLLVIEFRGDALKGIPAGASLTVDSGCSKGKLLNVVAQPNPETGGWRLSLELDPQGETLVEIHARLLYAGTVLSDTWLYRWTT